MGLHMASRSVDFSGFKAVLKIDADHIQGL